jgi:hypothetical protein
MANKRRSKDTGLGTAGRIAGEVGRRASSAADSARETVAGLLGAVSPTAADLIRPDAGTKRSSAKGSKKSSKKSPGKSAAKNSRTAAKKAGGAARSAAKTAGKAARTAGRAVSAAAGAGKSSRGKKGGKR